MERAAWQELWPFIEGLSQPAFPWREGSLAVNSPSSPSSEDETCIGGNQLEARRQEYLLMSSTQGTQQGGGMLGKGSGEAHGKPCTAFCSVNVFGLDTAIFTQITHGRGQGGKSVPRSSGWPGGIGLWSRAAQSVVPTPTAPASLGSFLEILRPYRGPAELGTPVEGPSPLCFISPAGDSSCCSRRGTTAGCLVVLDGR